MAACTCGSLNATLKVWSYRNAPLPIRARNSVEKVSTGCVTGVVTVVSTSAQLVEVDVVLPGVTTTPLHCPQTAGGEAAGRPRRLELRA